MLTREKVLAARDAYALRSLHTDPKAPGWLSNGAWAVYVGQDVDFYQATEVASGRLAGVLSKVKTLRSAGVTVGEVGSLRIPNSTRTVVRSEPGDGCNGCECGECPGWEEKGRRFEEEEKVRGQAVLETEGGERLLLDPDFMPLLEGLSMRVARDFTNDLSDPDRCMVAGFDPESGELRAVVMPMRGEPRQPGSEDGAGAA